MTYQRRAVWLLVGVLCVACVCGADSRDGPDADVRLQVEDDAVVVSMTLNLAFVDLAAPVARADRDVVAREEEERLLDGLLEFVSRDVPVEIDGERVDPVLRSFAVYNGEPAVARIYPKYGMRASGVAHLVVEYPAPPSTSSFSIEWRLFPDDVMVAPDDTGARPPMPIRASLRAHAGWQSVTLTQSEPRYAWRGEPRGEPELLPLPLPPRPASEPLHVPALGIALVVAAPLSFVAARSRRAGAGLALGLAGGGAILGMLGLGSLQITREEPSPMPTEQEVAGIFDRLLTNIYRSFDSSSESAVYDALARSVVGDELEDLYERVYRGLVLEEQGGAVARVERVENLGTVVEWTAAREADGRVACSVVATWRVTGTVTHWGHSHTRVNEYRGRYSIVGLEAGWRIVESRILEQRRLSPDSPLG